jgi:hypothetical protein
MICSPGSLRNTVQRLLLSSLLGIVLAAGLFGCSGSDDGGPGAVPTPALAPVADLAVVAGSETSLTLQWSSPQPAAKSGLSIRYDLRHTTQVGAAVPWDQWDPLPSPAADADHGQTHVHEVVGLEPGATYVFALRASSDGTVWSEPSSPVMGTVAADFDAVPPAAIRDLRVWGATESSLTVAWSVTGDDSVYGVASRYELRSATAPIDELNWDAATVVPGAPVAGEVAGKLQQTLSGLVAGQTYYCAVVAYDDEDQRSGLSNPCSGAAADLRVIRVYVDGSGDYPTIERAIAAADSGDLVLVGPGRYTWTNQGTGDPLKGLINVPRDWDGFEVRSMAGAAATIVDAEGQGGCWSVTGGSFSQNGEIYDYAGITIDGFTLTGGVANGVEASPDESWGGGGIYLHLSDTIIRNCIITGNEATHGGGVWIGGQGDARLENCVVANNSGRLGGGVMLINSDPRITVTGCRITDNTAAYGAGMFAYHCTMTLEKTIIARNSTTGRGGGLFAQNMNPGGEITACTIAGNRAMTLGSGLCIADNSRVTVTRTIVANNRDTAGLATMAGSVFELGCSIVYGNGGFDELPFGTVDLGGIMRVDPRLCGDDTFRPAAGSPCWPENRAADDCGVLGARDEACSSS